MNGESFDIIGIVTIMTMVSFFVVFLVLEEPFWHEVTRYSEVEKKNVSRSKKLNEYTIGSLFSLPFYLVTYAAFAVLFAGALILYPLVWAFIHPKTQTALHKFFSTPIFKTK